MKLGKIRNQYNQMDLFNIEFTILIKGKKIN